MPNILHCVPNVGKASCGLGQIAVNLAEAQRNKPDYNIAIWCVDSIENIKWASQTHGIPDDKIKGFPVFGPKKLGFSPKMEKFAESVDNKSWHVVHQHGIWTATSRVTAKLRDRYGIPSVIAPHGSLSEWALKKSAWKKRIALAAYERDNLEKAACLHATSESEISSFRDFNLRQPIAYIENGIPEKNLYICGDKQRFLKKYNIPNKKMLFFLSRITPKKGLLMLIETIKKIEDDFDGWILVIAGFDEFGHKAELELLIKKLKLTSKVKILPPLFNQEKADAFAAADLFALPSYSEGSPMVVLDSLATGVPVITTKSSSWEDINIYNCGWYIDINQKALEKVLKTACNLTVEELKEMGINGKQLIKSKYTWENLAHKTDRLYQWLLGQCGKPDFVLLK